MAEKNPEILRHLEQRIDRELLATFPFLVFSIAVPMSAWYGVMQLDDDANLWFQRSGSLVVLFAVWIEYRLFKIGSLTKPTSEHGLTYQDQVHRDALISRYGKKIRSYRTLTATIAIVGTVVWGYGDILRAQF